MRLPDIPHYGPAKRLLGCGQSSGAPASTYCLMETPSAVLSIDQKQCAHVCAWCESKDEAEAWCRTQSLRVTHGICPSCQRVLLAQSALAKL